MKLGLSIYVAAFVAQTAVAHAELIGVSRQDAVPAQAAPAPAAGAPMKITPPEVAEGEGSAADPRIDGTHGNEPEVKKWLKNFDLVVVIDKATQQLVAYRNSSANPADVTVSVALKGGVSSGNEQRECVYNRSKIPNDQGLFLYTKARAIYRNTPTGYYVPTKIEASHFSSEYDAAPMPNSVGFLANEGIYTHSKTAGEGPVGHLDKNGNPLGESHGCVRMNYRDSRDLFTMVAMTNDHFDPNEDAFHARCPRDPDTGKCSRPTDPDEESSLQKYYNNIKSGIYPGVIHDPKNPARNYDLKSNMPRLQPRDGASRPVLKVGKDGKVAIDPVTGEPQISNAPYNTLYIVRDSRINTAKNDRTLPPPPISCKSLKQLNADVMSGRDPSPYDGGSAAPSQQQQGYEQPFNLNPFAPGGLFNRGFGQPQQPAQPQPRRAGNR